jgi:serine/threonine-protein kinase
MLVGQTVGPFTIDKELGTGAMGTVYRAHYTKTGQVMALKIIGGTHDTSATSLGRFEREAAILKNLNHPNIVRYYGTGSYRKSPFFVMEYIEGETLENRLDRTRRFTWEEVVALGQQICSALQHAHEKGIVHRDLKPANIMLTADGTVKLTDFGIAKGLEITHQLTATNATVGTASYMSPEQCRGERNLTFKSDLYSLGVMFYELLTGRKPFEAETTLDMFLAHTEGKFERPSRLMLDIPVWLDTLVCQLLEKDPEKRPYDAAMVARSLNEIQEKVAAQRSAGVEMATARRVDLPRHKPKRDETDREAARLLREATTKVKVKRPVKPFYERGWFVLAAIGVVLLVTGGIFWKILQPPPPQVLYLQAKPLMESNDAEQWAKAREGPVRDFLRYYPDLNDAQAVEMRAWADKADLDQKERQLTNRLRLKLTPEGEAEALAHRATHYEDEGELDLARDRWRALEKFKEASDPEQRPWGLLGSKRLRDLRDADQRARQLRSQINSSRSELKSLHTATDPERQAALAIHAEMFGDDPMALDQWQRLKETYRTDPAQRTWVLIAGSKIRELRPKAHRGPDEENVRLKMIQDQLKNAEDLKRTKPHEAKVIGWDIVTLYGTKPDAAFSTLVDRARLLLH